MVWLLLGILLLAGCSSKPKLKLVEEEAPAAATSQRAPAGEFEPPPVAQTPRAEPVQAPDDSSAQRVEWKVLGGLDVRTGKTTPAVDKLHGARIEMRGYMVPFDDEDEMVLSFLLVPAAGMCIHTPAPPANQIVQVEVVSGNTQKVYWADPIKVVGQMEIHASESPYGPVAFKLNAESVRVLPRE
ncbi:MAG: DUF3299 domain-containing protein [Bryobacter sp.]|jgi:hypothetical protein|nr:DUF3299 domain-containing protein [Bryobacter sp.]